MDSILRKLRVLTRRVEVLDGLIRELIVKEGNYDPSIHVDCPSLICPRCKKMYGENKKLETLWDYAGGGSHYWHCICPYCLNEYYFDNHSNQLRER